MPLPTVKEMGDTYTKLAASGREPKRLLMSRDTLLLFLAANHFDFIEDFIRSGTFQFNNARYEESTSLGYGKFRFE